MYDFIIVGAGIAGAATAYELSNRGCNVLVLEKGQICHDGSYAAGAFLSPKISKPSLYKTYLNQALAYSLDLYEKEFPTLLHKQGLYKLPLDEQDAKRCQSYEPFIDDILWQKRSTGYFFPNAGIIETPNLCYALLKGIKVEKGIQVKNLTYKEKVWHINHTHTAKAVILATGSHSLPTPFNTISYLKSKNIGGYRYDVSFKTSTQQAHNFHKAVSISTYFEDKVVIGATHIKEKIDLNQAAQEDRYHLIAKAKEIQPLENLKILNTYIGYRNFSFDFFPFLGTLVHAKETLKAYPYIQTGAKVPVSKYHYYPNLYIHSALGSRGFVFAPYNAKLLADYILENKTILPELTPALRFQKWTRKLPKDHLTSL